MGSLLIYTRQKLLDHFFGKASFTQPTIYVALFKGDPEGAGVEVSAADYARKATAASDWDTADSSGITDNVNAIEFAEATNEWAGDASKITHFALYDASSGGNRLGSDDVPTSKAIGVGDTARFKAGDLTCQLT